MTDRQTHTHAHTQLYLQQCYISVESVFSACICRFVNIANGNSVKCKIFTSDILQRTRVLPGKINASAFFENADFVLKHECTYVI